MAWVQLAPRVGVAPSSVTDLEWQGPCVLCGRGLWAAGRQGVAWQGAPVPQPGVTPALGSGPSLLPEMWHGEPQEDALHM